MRTETLTQQTPETLTIDNILYIVDLRHTPETCEAAGLVNLAAHLREHEQAAHVYLRRPRGKRTYFAVQGLNGAYSSVTAMGGF